MLMVMVVVIIVLQIPNKIKKQIIQVLRLPPPKGENRVLELLAEHKRANY